jgi:DNA replication licensing factor MCM2
MEAEDKKKADEEIENREKKRVAKQGRLPRGIIKELFESDSDEEIERRKPINFRINTMEDEEYRDSENFINREDVKGNLSEWLRQVHVRRYIQLHFRNFIKNFKDTDENLVYEKIIIDMCSNNKQSLDINYNHIHQVNHHIASWILDYPQLIIPILNEVAFDLTCEIFPNYVNINPEIFVRIKDIPREEQIRNLRHTHINQLIKIKGVITKRTNVFSQLKKIIFFCTKCGEKKGPFFFNGSDDINLGSCLICQANGPFKIEPEETIYRNYQKLTIQESPDIVPPGRVPRQKEVIVINDMVDTIRPGDKVEIGGIYISRFEISNNVRHRFPIFTTFIEANHIHRLNDLEVSELTDDDKIEIRKLAKNPQIANIIFNSMAPSIYGQDFIKKAITLAMFGGESKDVQNKHKIRGDINVLMLGDPGTAKSQFLKYIQKIFNRSVYTTGKGASAVGLTAGVHKDPVTKEWTLEGGALVLADRGICLIDEFDKMNDQDRTSIHEAMEQQSISISKAGIVTTLQARCSVIAAANPKKGRYNNQLTFSDNVDLTEPILSRFDILCVVKDEIDLKADTALSTFVINSHINSHPDFKYNDKISLLPDLETEKKEVISQDILKKYIMYARKHIKPKLSDLNKNKVSKFYADLRKESEVVGGISIGIRHLESLLRISESHAKIHLREYVRADDIDFAIKMILESFLQSQKTSIRNNLKKNFAFYLNQQEDHNQLLMNVLNRVARGQVKYLFNIYFIFISLVVIFEIFQEIRGNANRD